MNRSVSIKTFILYIHLLCIGNCYGSSYAVRTGRFYIFLFSFRGTAKRINDTTGDRVSTILLRYVYPYTTTLCLYNFNIISNIRRGLILQLAYTHALICYPIMITKREAGPAQQGRKNIYYI